MSLKTKIEFENWASSLDLNELNYYDKILLKILCDNFNELYSKTTRGVVKRSDLIIKSIKNYKDEEREFVITSQEETLVLQKYPFQNINSLEVESFRGFIGKDIFEFSKNYNLVFGKNGSGKSSFFEALEYVFLNNIEEAEQRGIRLDRYIINTETGKSVKPRAYYFDEIGKKIEIVANPKGYQWMFIEKNRINNFSRVSATTPSKQTETISNLFGLEDFNNFVKNFTPNFSIGKEEANTNKLKELNQDLTNANANVENEKTNLETAKTNKEEIFNQFKHSKFYKQDILNIDELEKYVNGRDDEKGRIEQLREKAVSQKFELNIKSEIVGDIEKCKYESLENAKFYLEDKKKYDEKIDQINLKELYEKALEIKNKFEDMCPLCLTPINGFIRRTKANPYKNADEQLKKLEEADKLKKSKQNNFDEFVKSFIKLQKNIALVNQHKGKISYEINLALYEAMDIKEDKILEIEKSISECEDLRVENLVKLSKNIKAIQDENKRQDEIVSGIKAELQLLDSLSKEINTSNIIIQQIEQRKNTANEVIKNFNIANKELFEKVETEKEQNSSFEEFEKSYKKLIEDLIAYKDKLPLALLSDLNEKVAKYFNLINNHEEERGFEQIDKIKFPAKQEEEIIIYFKDSPNKPINALHTLSEGHLKCLGLSIILAKSVSENVPILIFDDVINAIDDDHREGIRDLLFANSEINQKQIILTSHGEQFITQTINEIKKNGDCDKCKEISFILSNEKGIRSIKDFTRHYLVSARSNYQQGKEIDCMKDCRYALSNIVFYLWKKLRNKGQDHFIGVKQRYGKEPELYSIVCGMKKKCEEISGKAGVDFKGIPEILKILLEQNNWDTLNTASHHQNRNEEKIGTITVKLVLDKITELSYAVDEF